MNATAWSRGLEVTGGGTGVVSHAGLVLVRQLADRTGLTAPLISALQVDEGRAEPIGVIMSDATDAPVVTVTANSAAAIGNAVYDALGIRVRTLPLSPENITAAMPD